jgi:hypothetical protein
MQTKALQVVPQKVFHHRQRHPGLLTSSSRNDRTYPNYTNFTILETKHGKYDAWIVQQNLEAVGNQISAQLFVKIKIFI